MNRINCTVTINNLKHGDVIGGKDAGNTRVLPSKRFFKWDRRSIYVGLIWGMLQNTNVDLHLHTLTEKLKIKHTHTHMKSFQPCGHYNYSDPFHGLVSIWIQRADFAQTVLSHQIYEKLLCGCFLRRCRHILHKDMWGFRGETMNQLKKL